MEKREPSYPVGGNVSWYGHCGKLRKLLRKLKIKLPYDSAISLLGRHPDKTTIQKATCTLCSQRQYSQQSRHRDNAHWQRNG